MHVCRYIETHRSHPLPSQQGGCMACHFPALFAETEASPTPRHTHTFLVLYKHRANFPFRLWVCAQWFPILCDPHGLEPTRLLCSRDFPGKNTGVDCHFLLQGIFLTQGSNTLLCLLSLRRILDHLSHWESLPLGWGRAKESWLSTRGHPETIDSMSQRQSYYLISLRETTRSTGKTEEAAWGLEQEPRRKDGQTTGLAGQRDGNGSSVVQ